VNFYHPFYLKNYYLELNYYQFNHFHHCDCPRNPVWRPHRELAFDPRRLSILVDLPYANLVWTAVLVVVIGFIFSSVFSAIVVFAQELVPGRVGRISLFPFRLCSCIDGA
jgi:hypothetical protein